MNGTKIAFYLPKGGTGKSSSTAATGVVLAEEHHKRVLIGDVDPQGNTSEAFGMNETEFEMSDLFECYAINDGRYKIKDMIQKTVYPNIDIIPSSGNLMLTDKFLNKNTETDQVRILERALNEVLNDYDYILLDCGVRFDPTTINALFTANLIVATIKNGGHEKDALLMLIEQIEELKMIKPDLKIKSLMTMFQGNNENKEMLDWIKTNSDSFETVIRRSIVAEKATKNKVPVTKLRKNCNVSKDYREFTKEIIDLFEEKEA